MIKIKEAIIVEGKYDKMKLSSIIDGLIIQTNGFRIFKDKKKVDLIKKLAEQRGILIITDSDSSGFVIRNYISGIVAKDKIKQAYIPNLYGKEKRKSKFSKEGKIGVEGIDEETLISSIKRAGVKFLDQDDNLDDKIISKAITKQDFYKDGLYGGKNSRTNRLKLINYLNLPEYLSVDALIEVSNSILTYDKYKKIIEELEIK